MNMSSLTFKIKKAKTDSALTSSKPSADALLDPTVIQPKPAPKKRRGGSARSPSSFAPPRHHTFPSINSVIETPPPTPFLEAFNLQGLPKEVVQIATAAAVDAAAKVAAAVANQYYQQLETHALLPSRSVSPVSVVSVSTEYTESSLDTSTSSDRKSHGSVATIKAVPIQQSSIEESNSSLILQDEEEIDDYPDPFQMLPSSSSQSREASPSQIESNLTRSLQNTSLCSDSPEQISPTCPPKINTQHLSSQLNWHHADRVGECLADDKPSSYHSSSKIPHNFQEFDATSLPPRSRTLPIPITQSRTTAPLLSSASSTSTLFHDTKSDHHLFSTPSTPPNQITNSAIKETSLQSSQPTVHTSSECPSPCTLPVSSLPHKLNDTELPIFPETFSGNSSVPPTATVAPTTQGSASGADRSDSTSVQPGDPRTEVWTNFYNFTANTRHSDSLVYALARKEAYAQTCRAKENTNIIDLWIIMGLRFTMKGQLLFSPAAQLIHGDTPNRTVLLDVQGVFRDQWSWQMALDFPKAMVYGFKFALNNLRLPVEEPTLDLSDSSKTRRSSVVSNSSVASSPSAQSTQSAQSYQTATSAPPSVYNIDSKGVCQQLRRTQHGGPSNYVPCTGHSLKKLPFDDNTFDVISAKSLWYFVKRDEWVDVLKELHRVIKPGGYIEIVASDFALLNSSSSDEYWWNRLRTGVRRAGIDPFPSASVPDRLYKAGFVDINRALLTLPRGWSGQVGHLTDLLAMYYTESMFSTFSDLSPEEMEAFKINARAKVEAGYYPANRLTLIYARKAFDDI